MSFSPEFKKQLVELSGIKISPELADQVLNVKKQVFETLSLGNTQLTRERFDKVFDVVLRKYDKENILKSNMTGLVREVVVELGKERAYPDSNYKKPKPEDKRAETVRIRQQKEKYPYEYPERLEEDKEKNKKKESVMPKLINGSIQIDDFIRWLKHIADYRKMPLDVADMKRVLTTSKRFAALFNDKTTGMLNPIVLSIVEELIHSSR